MDTDSMQARFLLTEHDYVQAGGLYARPTRRTAAVLGTGLAVLVGWALWGPHGHGLIAAGGAAGGVAGACVVHFVWSPWLLRRHYRRYRAIQEEQTVELFDGGLRFSSADGEGRLSWEKILKWRHNADYLLIYPMPRLYYVLPAAVAAQGFDLDRLKALLACHVGPAV